MATYVRQSSFSDGDTITAALFNNEFNQLVNAFNVATGHTHDGSTAGDGGPISNLFSNALVFGTNTDNDVVITFNAASNDGVLSWMEDEDYFQFSDDLLIATSEKIQFRDTAIYINSSTDGQLDIVADTEVQIAATTIDMNGNADISGNLGVGGNLTVTGTTTFNGGTITMGDAATDNVVFGADVDSHIIPDDDDTYDLGSSTQEWRNLYIDGTANIDSLVADTADINGGTIDAANITVGSGKTLDVSAGTLTLADNQISGDKVEGGTINATTINTLTYGSITDGTITVTAFVDEDDMSSNSATLIPTQQSVKAYVDAQDTAQDLDLVSDSGTIAIDLDGETLTVTGGEGIDTSASSNTLTITGEDATTSNKGIASFNSDDFNVSSGAVTLATTSTAAELNILDGATLTTAELNILDGVTSTAAELNILDGKAFLDEDDMASNSATGIASQQSIKAYVDSQVTAQDLDFQGDTGGALSIDLDSESLTIAGGTGLDTVGSGNTVTINIDSTVATLTGSQTLTNKSLTAPTLTGTATVASLDISGDIDVDGTTNLDVVDIDGAVAMATSLTIGGTSPRSNYVLDVRSSGGNGLNIQAGDESADVVLAVGSTSTADKFTITSGGAVTTTGVVTANAGVVVDNITIDGNEIDVSSGNFVLDVAGEIELDADGGKWIFLDGGTQIGRIENSSSDLVIKASVNDKDIKFNGEDGGSNITALTLDMSAAGAATFNSSVTATKANVGTSTVNYSGTDLTVGDNADSQNGLAIQTSTSGIGYILFGDGSGASAYRGEINYSHSTDSITFKTAGAPRLTIDSSGAATFNSTVSAGAGQFTGVTGTSILKAIGADSNGQADIEILSTGTTGSSRLFFSDTAAQSGSITYSHNTNLMTASSAGGITLDAAGDIILDADGGNLKFADGGAVKLDIYEYNSNLYIDNQVSNSDIIFQGVDGSTSISALTLDMSDAGTATFNNDINSNGNININGDYLNLTNAFRIRSVSGQTGQIGFNRDPAGGANLGESSLARFQINGPFSGSNYLDFQAYHSNGNYQGGMRLEAGALVTVPTAGAHAVFNENGVNADFRVESDGNTHMLFVDGGGNKVLIGHSGGSQTISPLHVRKNGANIEFGHGNNGAGYYGTLGAWGNAGHPYIGFSTDCEDSANTFSTRGHKGNIIYNNVATGSLIFSQLTTASATGQTPVERVAIGQSEMVINDASSDYDFRVESNNYTHMLFVDAGNDHVNIGGSTDFGGILNVNGGLNTKQAVFTSTNNRGLALSTASRAGQNDGVAIIDAQDTEATGGRFEIHTMGAERARFERDQIVFNESGNDQDFRVESDANAYGFYLDGGANFISMGNTVKNPATGFGDQHGIGIDLLTGVTQISADGASVFGRTSTGGTGDILEFRDASVAIGRIRTEGTNDITLYSTASNHTGLRLGEGYYIPTNNSGASADNAVDLGLPSVRYKDLYLSGGVVFGTTGGSVSSKTLDDYEEGTFTPSFEGSGSNPTVNYNTQSAIYTRIGNLVHIEIRIVTNSVSGGSGNLTIAGLPFPSRSFNSVGGAMTKGFAYNWATDPEVFSTSGSSIINIYSNDAANTQAQVSHLNTTSGVANYLNISGTYLI